MSRQQTLHFGALLKTLRTTAGLTQEALAERAGLSVRGLQDLEGGQSRRPHRDTVELLATALSLSTADRAAFLALAAPQPRRPPEAPQSDGPLDPSPGALPTPLTALLGRAREVEEVSALLLREEVRLLTLTGPGGVGKTRLALQVARSLSEHRAGGVAFVDLTPLRDARLVPHAIAQALGLAERGGQRLREALVTYLQARPMLLLLDNAEHILEAVAEVAALRAACPALRLLVTSRVALRVQGEQVYPVPPLALPTTGEVTSAEALGQVAAVALFVQRARAVRPDFALTEANAGAAAAICARLDGLPLAIELAAVRVESLTVEGIAARLDDRFRLLTSGSRDALPRHRTLRAALDWSYDLLSPPEQRLLERLAVFAGGWTLPAAEAICAGGAVEGRAVLDLLGELVHKSLVQIQETPGGLRYGLLETVRQYGAERLEASGAAVRERHLEWFLTLAEEAAPQLRGVEQGRWLDRLEADQANLRAALGWAQAQGRAQVGLWLAVALTRFWMLRGHLQEGRGWLNGLLGLPGGDQALRARALGAAGLLAFDQTDYDEAIALLDEALALSGPLERSLEHGGDAEEWQVIRDEARSMRRGDAAEGVALLEESVARFRTWKDRPGLARALTRLGFELRLRGEHPRARASLEEGVAGYRELGDALGLARAVYYLALVVREQGDYARATALSEEAVALARALQARHGLAWALLGLCDAARDQGVWARVGPPAEESLALSRALGIAMAAAFALHNMALAAHGLGDAAQARALLAESQDLVAAQGMPYARAEILHSQGLLARDVGDWATARALMAESLTQFGAGGMLGHVPRSLEGLASVLALQAASGAPGPGSRGMADRAARLLAAATAQRAARGTPLPPAERPAYDQAVRTVRALLGQEAAAVAWAAGEALRPEQAVADALVLVPPPGGTAVAPSPGAPALLAPPVVEDGRSKLGSPPLATESLVPLVGRAGELALLDRFLAGEREPLGSAPALVLAGEPGIGKTRLLQAAAQRAIARGWCVLAGGCHRRGGQEPYAPVLDALAQHLQARAPAHQRAALAGCGWLVRLLPELAAVLEPVPAGSLAPEQERRLVFAAVARLLANVAGPGGTLLVLDDLQWAGTDALDLLATLLRTSALPLRVLGAYRDTEVHPADPLGLLLADLAQARLVRQHALGPLATEEAANLLDGLLVDLAAEDRGLVEGALQRAGGTPFFLVSYAQALHQGSLAGVPWDIAQGVRQRVALLPAAGQELLGVAAVVGRRASRALLLAVAEQPKADALAGLEADCRARLLLEDGADAYAFAHDVIREVVEADLGTARRAMLHRKVAEVLDGDQAGASPETIAYHYDRGGAPDKAVRYLEQAGDRAWAQRAHAAAESQYRAVLDRLEGLGCVHDALRVREKLGEVLTRMGRYEAALQVLEPAAVSYRAAGDREGLGRVAAGIAEAANANAPSEAMARLQPLLEELECSGASAPPAALYLWWGVILISASRYDKALAALERAAELARAGSDGHTLVWAGVHRADILQRLGQFKGALRAYREVRTLAETMGDLEILVAVHRDLAYIYTLQGAFAAGKRHSDQSLTLAEQLENPLNRSVTLAMRSWLVVLSGDAPAAHADLDLALAWGRQLGQSWHWAYVLIFRARLSLVEGDWAVSATSIREAIALAEGSGDLQALRWASTTMAEIEILEDRPEAARACLLPLLDRPGLQECDVTVLLPVLAWAQLALGQVEQAAGTVEQALERARPEEMRLVLVEALRVRALVALRRGQRDEAVCSLEEGLELARGMPYPYAEAQLLQVYGQLHAQTGDTKAARERLAGALASFARLGTRREMERVEQALAALSQKQTPSEVGLTDAQWAQIEAMLPPRRQGRGRPRANDRRTLEAILYVQRMGCAWAELPATLGDEATAHRRLQQWQAAGLWERIAAIVQVPPA